MRCMLLLVCASLVACSSGADPAPDATPASTRAATDPGGGSMDPGGSSAGTSGSSSSGASDTKEPAVAPLGKDALLFYGEGGIEPTSGPYLADHFFVDVPNVLKAVGVDSTASDTLPADLTPFAVVFWPGPGSRVTSDAAAPRLLEHAKRGARIVVIGDWDYSDYGAYSGVRSNAYINALLGRWGANIGISGQHGSAPTPCPTGAPASPLLGGQQSVATYGATFLTIGVAATWVDCSVVARAVLGKGDVVVTADVNMFGTMASSNTPFIQRLATWHDAR